MIKKLPASLFFLLFFAASSAFSQDFSRSASKTPYVPGELIVMFYENVKPEAVVRQFAHTRSGSTGIKHNTVLSELSNIHLFSFDEAAVNGDQLLRNIRGVRYVRAAQFNHFVEERSTAPNDPQFGSQWHHDNIDSELAWDITTGGTTANGDDIVVAVIESANYNHNDLIDNHWVNTAEIPGNGIDDDGNGFTDDYNGWNPGGNNDNVCCGGHGTAVSGMIGAKGNNGIGGSGVNWDVQIMNVTVGSLTESNVIASYNYPYTMRNLYNTTGGAEGAFVVATNASWGIDNANPANYPVWCNYYDDLGAVGILNCGATANNNVNIDQVGDMPTGCGSDYMVAVTATNSSDTRTFSGYGLNTIDLAAPGASVLLPSGSSGYSSTNGTSFASPCVAGGIGLVYSAPCETLAGLALADPQAAADAVRGYIYDGVDQTAQLLTETVTGGRLNVFNAVNNALDDCGPPPTCDAEAISLAAECVLDTNGDVTASVTVDAQFDGAVCQAVQVCYSINGGNVNCIDIAAAGGQLTNTESFTVGGLLSSTTYTFYYTTGAGSSPEQNITTPDCASIVAGCTNPDATNYNPNATIDNGTCIFPCNDVTLTINTDCWGGEVSWEILDADGNEIAAVSSGTYGNQETYTWSECLDYGCYSFNIYDSFGDGMSGASYSFCGVNGNYGIVNNQTGDDLVVMTAPDADYGSEANHTFCLEAPEDPEPEVPACEMPYPQVGIPGLQVQPNGVQMTWDAILGSKGCQVQGGLANSSSLQVVEIIEDDLNSFFIPGSQLPLVNEIYRLRVRCGCQRNPTTVVGPWSDWAYVFWTGGGSNLVQPEVEARFAGEDRFELRIQPNPTEGAVVMNLFSDREQEVFVRVFDMVGKMVHAEKYSTVAGTNVFRHDFSNLETAVYLIRVEGSDGRIDTERLVISK